MWRITLVALVGCGDQTRPPENAQPDATIEADSPAVATGTCSGSGRDKIMFSLEESCANDGSVEWCIPDNDPMLRARLTVISPSISCAPGGGRAGCYAQPGLLLCFYPTSYPGQCLAVHGEMTAETWADMCAIAAEPQITQIVATFFE